MQTKRETEVFLMPSGKHQRFPHTTIDDDAAIVPLNDSGTYHEYKVVHGIAYRKTPDELSAHELSANERLARLKVSEFGAQLDSIMNDAARSYGYDDIKTAVTYAEEPSVPKFQNEGLAFRKWRSECYAYAYEQMSAVTAVSTFEEFKVGMPELYIA